MQTAPPPVRLTELGGLLRRRIGFVAVCAAIGLVLGLIAWFLLPVRYTATTTVEVTPPETTNAAISAAVATDARFVTSGDVMTVAAKELSATRDEVAAATSVVNPSETNVLEITYEADTARAAATGAQTVATTFLTVRTEQTTAEIETQQKAAWDSVKMLEKSAEDYPSGSPARESIRTQAASLGSRAAELATLDPSAGRIVGDTSVPSAPSSLGLAPMAIGGLALGALLGAAFVLVRRRDEAGVPAGAAHGAGSSGASSTSIGSAGASAVSARGLSSSHHSALPSHSVTEHHDGAVLDGTRDPHPGETWDIATIMLKMPALMPTDQGYLIMLDATGGVEQGAALVEALRRRGRQARFVSAGAINESKIARGWPTARKKETWAGEIVVIDTSLLSSDALRVHVATRSNQVVFARSGSDDPSSTQRLSSLLRAQGIDVDLTVLLPQR